ncbi:MAG: hypothetical protein V1792_03365 [Pseudomonadota bacterium]
MANRIGTSMGEYQKHESRGSAEGVFHRIRDAFRGMGLLGRSLVVEHEGNRYRVSCDEQSFMVYRVNDNGGLRHHVPGWPVCLVNVDMIFEECSCQELGQDHYACGLDIEKWLELVGRRDCGCE